MIQYVATEYGIAKLTGLTLKERADAMIAIAHPDFRDELRGMRRRILNKNWKDTSEPKTSTFHVYL